jgi:hypothetical protein
MTPTPTVDWDIIGVFDPEATNATVHELSVFAYSVGLRRHGLPELWCSALSDNGRIISHAYLTVMLNRIAAGLIDGTLSGGDELREPSEHGDLVFRLAPLADPDAWDAKQCYQAEPGPVLVVSWTSPLGSAPTA